MIKHSIIALLCLSSPAHALSCAPPSVGSSFGFFDRAEESYVVFHGDIVLPKGAKMYADRPGDPEDYEALNNRQGYEVEAQIVGNLASRTGFNSPINAPVTINVSCLAAWCGATPKGEVLAFVQKRSDASYQLSIGPCPGAVFQPDEKALRAVKRCMNGRCPKDTPFR